jgi:hypothetical protein
MGCTGVKRNTREQGKHWSKTTPHRGDRIPIVLLVQISRGVRREERPIVIAFD